MGDLIQSAPFMSLIKTIIVFDDLTYNFQRDLQQLLHVKDNANLADLFACVFLAFRQEFALLAQLERKWLPRYGTG